MDIVEKVARAIDEASDYRPAYPDEWRKCARAAIRATLQHYIENVSEGMVEAIHEAILAGSEGDGYGNITDFNVTEKTVSSAFSKALAELDA